MALNITADQFSMPLQGIQNRYLKLELLNYNYQTVDEVSGIAIAGTITIDANSDVRRTATIDMIVKDSSFDVQSGGRIWLDKYIRINVGTESLRTGEIVWVNCGLYIIDAPTYNYAPETNSLSLSLLDLMAKLTGARNGYLPGVPTILSAGENIREAIIDTLALGGFTKYVVEEAPFPSVIPNDLEFSQGATVYDLLAGLRDIYPNHEIYFDVDGVFYYKEIPTGIDEPIMMDDTLFDSIVINEAINVDFQNVKNSIEVWGRTHDPQHFSTSTSVSSNTISLTIEDVTSYTEHMVYGFTLTDNPGYTAPSLKINSLATYPIKRDDGENADIEAEEGEVYYCVEFLGDSWRWLGHLQAYGFAEDDDPESPFYVEGTVGRIHLPLYDGDYANCITDDLAQERAEYELWLHTNMNNTLSLTMVPVYWLDVNMLVEYTQKRNNELAQWLIKSISVGLAPTDSMSLTLMRFYGEALYDEDYIALQYIESSGTQYVDAEFAPNQDTRIVADVQILKAQTSEGHICSSNDGTNYFTLYFNSTQSGWYGSRYANNAAQTLPSSVNSRERITIDKDKNVTTIDDQSVTATIPSDDFQINQNLTIFCRNNNGSKNSYIKMRLYGLRIYDDDNLVRSFIPAQDNATKAIGLYDTVQLKFYGNSGSGAAFTAGPAVNSGTGE